MTTYKTLDGYVFYPNKDSHGNDLMFVPGTSINELKNIANLIPECSGFNSEGWLKSIIVPPNKFTNLDNQNSSSGLYVKITLTGYKIICINLKRRQDRKNNMVQLFNQNYLNNYHFITAIDGSKLVLDDYLKKLFSGNDFASKPSVMGCALSHYAVWLKLINDVDNDYYLVLEDDVEFANDFKNKLHMVMNMIGGADIVYLGYTMAKKSLLLNKAKYRYNNNLSLHQVDQSLYIGGFFGYVISKHAANKLVKYISINGIKRAIDWLPLMADLNLMEVQPHIITTESNDSDIVHEYQSIYK